VCLSHSFSRVRLQLQEGFLFLDVLLSQVYRHFIHSIHLLLETLVLCQSGLELLLESGVVLGEGLSLLLDL
jgi:hypothetical protein